MTYLMFNRSGKGPIPLRQLSMALFVLLLSACASTPGSDVEPVVEDISSSADETVVLQAPGSKAGADDIVSNFLVQASVHLEAGELERAAAVSERAIRLAPGDPRGYFALAQVRYHQAQFALSASLLEKARSLASGSEIKKAIDSFFSKPGLATQRSF